MEKLPGQLEVSLLRYFVRKHRVVMQSITILVLVQDLEKTQYVRGFDIKSRVPTWIRVTKKIKSFVKAVVNDCMDFTATAQKETEVERSYFANRCKRTPALKRCYVIGERRRSCIIKN